MPPVVSKLSHVDLVVSNVCTEVPSRALVDERAASASESAGSLLSEPAEHDYTPGYYAALMLDPDGIKLELLHRPTYWQDAGR